MSPTRSAAAILVALTIASCDAAETERTSSSVRSAPAEPSVRSRPRETPPPSPRPVRRAEPRSSWGKPVLVDGFDGDRVDTSKWLVYDYPDARVNPRTKAATKVEDGTLKLTGGVYKGKDLSGGIASRLNQKHGRWEVRIRAEKGVGYSAVALLWPKVFGKPEHAEIDFAEVIDSARQNVGIFIHHGPDNRMAQRNVRRDATRWHTYAVDWLPRSLTFWVDGKKVWSYRGPLTPERSTMGLALQNDQVCDRGPGFCRTRGTPRWVTMHVDWVKIYKRPR
ncbi:glycoside hydrolase family 16 protein [Actinomadura rudentiformis]|uniref:Glycoside hydrolase family 16 protein n=1 Tax=Actinomadura rudentiformis TaxID=359158 RepID=A0A6H9YQR7_9ACTN|nr:glycoside hydrolase family 16 protein [Actinomadura rudentiformis]